MFSCTTQKSTTAIASCKLRVVKPVNKTLPYFCYKRKINIDADTKTGAKFLESGRQVTVVNIAHELVPIPHQQAFNDKKQCTEFLKHVE